MYKDEQETYKDEQETYKDEQETYKEEQETYKDEQETYKDEQETYKDEQETYKDERFILRLGESLFFCLNAYQMLFHPVKYLASLCIHLHRSSDSLMMNIRVNIQNQFCIKTELTMLIDISFG